jgi:hypothetical protein
MLKDKVKKYYNNTRPEGITKENIQNIHFLTAPTKLRRATNNTVPPPLPPHICEQK